jgi:hypothetical protein
MTLVWDRPQYVADWVAAQSGHVAPSVDAAIGLESRGRMVSGVYFDGLNGNNIFAHVAGRPSVGLLQALVVYLRWQLRIGRVTFQVPEDNGPAARFVLKMGAKLEAKLADAARPGVALNLYGIHLDCPLSQRLLTRAWRNK